jgi:hypothetical protein
MKRKLLPLSAALFVIAAFEGHAFGLGVQIGGHWNPDAMGYNASVLISPYERLHIALNYFLFSDDITAGGTVDYWIIDRTLSSDGLGSTDFFLGLGAFISVVPLADPFVLDAGPRIPIGIDYAFPHLDIYFQAAPAYILDLRPKFGLGGFRLNLSIGLRFWTGGRKTYRPLI